MLYVKYSGFLYGPCFDAPGPTTGSLAGGFSFAAAAALGFGVLAFGTSAE